MSDIDPDLLAAIAAIMDEESGDSSDGSKPSEKKKKEEEPEPVEMTTSFRDRLADYEKRANA